MAYHFFMWFYWGTTKVFIRKPGDQQCVVPENIHTPPPPPPKNIGNSEGEGAFKGGNFQGVGGGGFMGNYFLKGDGLRTKH